MTRARVYPITSYQPLYFVCDSFKVPVGSWRLSDSATQTMTKQLREFARTLNRPFEVTYNPFSQKVNVHDVPLS